jgi:hypothetical protein
MSIIRRKSSLTRIIGISVVAGEVDELDADQGHRALEEAEVGALAAAEAA